MKNTAGEPEAVDRNPPFLEVLEIDASWVVFMDQVHSDRVLNLEAGGSRCPGPADGLITETIRQFPVIRSADCVPALVISARQRRVCALHAGWRGTAARIVEKGIRGFLQATGAKAADLLVALGPCIRTCCYQVGEEVRQHFARSGHAVDEIFRDSRLDLIGANRLQLEALGVSRILDSGQCTACRTDLFYSYRKEGETGRIWSLAGFVE